MSEENAILFANEAFYDAFAARDLSAMSAIWSARHPVQCVHPGWPPLHGRAVVMESWQGILGNPQSPRIACRAPRAVIVGEIGIVTCFEVIESATLVATNLFVREHRAWRLIHHQASPTGVSPPEEEAPRPLQ